MSKKAIDLIQTTYELIDNSTLRPDTRAALECLLAMLDEEIGQLILDNEELQSELDMYKENYTNGGIR